MLKSPDGQQRPKTPAPWLINLSVSNIISESSFLLPRSRESVIHTCALMQNFHTRHHEIVAVTYGRALEVLVGGPSRECDDANTFDGCMALARLAENIKVRQRVRYPPHCWRSKSRIQVCGSHRHACGLHAKHQSFCASRSRHRRNTARLCCGCIREAQRQQVSPVTESLPEAADSCRKRLLSC